MHPLESLERSLDLEEEKGDKSRPSTHLLLLLFSREFLANLLSDYPIMGDA